MPSRPILALLLAASTVACAAPAPDGGRATAPRAEDPVAHGEYLVSLLACGRCHTQGYLTGDVATGPELAGSRVGIAWTRTSDGETPGLAFPPNLTPDPETGLGRWSEQQIVDALRAGVGPDGHRRLELMPWAAYGANLYDEDLRAIAAYLKSLAPIRREIPERTQRGEPTEYPYVRIGVFRYEPR